MNKCKHKIFDLLNIHIKFKNTKTKIIKDDNLWYIYLVYITL